MSLVRTVDLDAAQVRLPGGFRAHVLYAEPACVLIAAHLPPGAAGPPWHTHVGAQLSLVLEGRLTVEDATTERTAGPGDTLRIAAGVPHRAWNAGEEDELHLEIIAPGVRPGDPIAIPLEEGEDPHARAAADDPYDGGGVALAWTTLEPGSQALLPRHPAERLCFVVEGALSVQAGAERLEVGPSSLVLLHARVEHRLRSAGGRAARYVVVEPDATAAPPSS